MSEQAKRAEELVRRIMAESYADTRCDGTDVDLAQEKIAAAALETAERRGVESVLALVHSLESTIACLLSQKEKP